MYKVKKKNLYWAVSRINRLPDKYEGEYGVYNLLTERELDKMEKLGIVEVDLSDFDEFYE